MIVEAVVMTKQCGVCKTGFSRNQEVRKFNQVLLFLKLRDLSLRACHGDLCTGFLGRSAFINWIEYSVPGMLQLLHVGFSLPWTPFSPHPSALATVSLPDRSLLCLVIAESDTSSAALCLITA